MAFIQTSEIVISAIKEFKYDVLGLLKGNKRVRTNRDLGNTVMRKPLVALERNLFIGSAKYAPAGQDVQIVFDAKGDGVKGIILVILLF